MPYPIIPLQVYYEELGNISDAIGILQLYQHALINPAQLNTAQRRHIQELLKNNIDELAIQDEQANLISQIQTLRFKLLADIEQLKQLQRNLTNIISEQQKLSRRSGKTNPSSDIVNESKLPNIPLAPTACCKLLTKEQQHAPWLHISVSIYKEIRGRYAIEGFSDITQTMLNFAQFRAAINELLINEQNFVSPFASKDETANYQLNAARLIKQIEEQNRIRLSPESKALFQEIEKLRSLRNYLFFGHDETMRFVANPLAGINILLHKLTSSDFRRFYTKKLQQAILLERKFQIFQKKLAAGLDREIILPRIACLLRPADLDELRTEEFKLSDLTTTPLQRAMRYALTLRKIIDHFNSVATHPFFVMTESDCQNKAQLAGQAQSFEEQNRSINSRVGVVEEIAQLDNALLPEDERSMRILIEKRQVLSRAIQTKQYKTKSHQRLTKAADELIAYQLAKELHQTMLMHLMHAHHTEKDFNRREILAHLITIFNDVIVNEAYKKIPSDQIIYFAEMLYATSLKKYTDPAANTNYNIILFVNTAMCVLAIAAAAILVGLATGPLAPFVIGAGISIQLLQAISWATLLTAASIIVVATVNLKAYTVRNILNVLSIGLFGEALYQPTPDVAMSLHQIPLSLASDVSIPWQLDLFKDRISDPVFKAHVTNPLKLPSLQPA